MHRRAPRSTRLAVIVFLFCAACAQDPGPGKPGPAAQASAAARATLPPEVLTALAAAQVPPEALSVVVRSASGLHEPLLHWQDQRAVNPASLMKLVTTFAALDLLGPAWTWTTRLWLNGTVRDLGPQGTLEGDLVIEGSGDPTLVVERVWLMLRRLRQLGVQTIRGDIVLDRHRFTALTVAPADFDGEPLKPYNVQPDALLLNHKAIAMRFSPLADGRRARVSAEPPLEGVQVPEFVDIATGTSSACGDWQDALRGDFRDPSRLRFDGALPRACGERVWQLAYAEPASYNARLLRSTWRELGGTLTGSVRDGPAPTTPANIEFESPPLAEVVRDINKFSNNPMAEQLFLSLGDTKLGDGSPTASRTVLQGWLATRTPQGPTGVVIDNGSGLSRETRLSAAQLASLLVAAWNSPTMPELLSSLPVSGLDGTLRRSRAPRGLAHLKTGSLRDVAGIAGYVDAVSPTGAPTQRRVVVAIVNHPNANAARPAFDALVTWAASTPPAP